MDYSYNSFANGGGSAPIYDYNNANSFQNYSTDIPETSYDLSLRLESKPEQRSDDELWVETWLSLLGKIHINLDSTIDINPKLPNNTPKNVTVNRGMSIHTAKTNLKSCLQIVGKLKELQKDLETNISNMTSVEWKKRTIEIGELKDEFSSLMCQFRNSDTLMGLRKAVQNRKRKRNSQKQRKVQRRQTLQSERERCKKLHKDIDQWLLGMKDAVERVKTDENLRKDADCVLSEVTKKKLEARKQLSVISALVRLRSVRELQAVQRGEKVASDDSRAFKHVTDRLTKIWENALQVYTKEEQGLRMMLEQNAAEDSNAAKLEKDKRVTQEWDHILFGPKCVPSPAYWGLTLANKNFETFIAIRKSWDTFLVSGDNQAGSRIPMGWVLPNASASEHWKRYLQNS